MKIWKNITRLTFMAATVYSGWAAYTFLRYGRPRKRKPVDNALDRYMPDPEVAERHCIGVQAPTDVTYDTCCAFDVDEMRIAGFLFDTRARIMGVKPVAAEKTHTGFVENMKKYGWTVLEETPGHEIVFGVGAQPWIADAGFRTIPADQFTEFNEPGWVKIIMNVSVDSVARCCSLVTTETRALATDAEARKHFRRYWSLVVPGVKIIRITMLRAIKAAAEARAPKELKAATSAA